MAYFGSFLWEIGIVLIISVAVSQQKTSRMYDLHQKIFVLLNEICDLPNEVYNMSDISARFRKEFTPDVEIVFLNTPGKELNSLLSNMKKVFQNHPLN